MDASDEKGGAGEGEALDRSLVPADERERWLDTMADMQAQADRRYDSIMSRLGKLERKGSETPEEMKTLFMMLTVYVGVYLLLPFVLEQVEQWRSRS